MQHAVVNANLKCPHLAKAEASGLALVTIGDSLRGDDGIAAALCNALPDSLMDDVCRFDIGSLTGFLGVCLSGHKAAIIVDSTNNGNAPGTVTILDLGTLLSRVIPLNIESCHGFSLADELRSAKRSGTLPKRLIFFGVEASETNWAAELTPELKMRIPNLVKNLSSLVGKVVESVKRNA